MSRVREIRRLRRRVRVGAPDASLTPVSGMLAVTELVDRLNMIRLLDAAIGPIKVCGRGFTGGCWCLPLRLPVTRLMIRRAFLLGGEEVVEGAESAGVDGAGCGGTEGAQAGGAGGVRGAVEEVSGAEGVAAGVGEMARA